MEKELILSRIDMCLEELEQSEAVDELATTMSSKLNDLRTRIDENYNPDSKDKKVLGDSEELLEEFKNMWMLFSYFNTIRSTSTFVKIATDFEDKVNLVNELDEMAMALFSIDAKSFDETAQNKFMQKFDKLLDEKIAPRLDLDFSNKALAKIMTTYVANADAWQEMAIVLKQLDGNPNLKREYIFKIGLMARKCQTLGLLDENLDAKLENLSPEQEERVSELRERENKLALEILDLLGTIELAKEMDEELEKKVTTFDKKLAELEKIDSKIHRTYRSADIIESLRAGKGIIRIDSRQRSFDFYGAGLATALRTKRNKIVLDLKSSKLDNVSEVKSKLQILEDAKEKLIRATAGTSKEEKEEASREYAEAYENLTGRKLTEPAQEALLKLQKKRKEIISKYTLRAPFSNGRKARRALISCLERLRGIDSKILDDEMTADDLYDDLISSVKDSFDSGATRIEMPEVIEDIGKIGSSIKIRRK